jgi:mono/diheme cytochrome c family protein
MTIRHLVLAAAVTFTTQAFAADIDAPALWKKHCKGCHGDTGKADTKKGKEYEVDDLTTADWQSKHKDEDIKKVISEGLPKSNEHKFKDKMKPFKEKMSPEEIDALVKFVRTLKG